MADRRQAERRGRRAEAAAALYLIAQGYRVLARRVRTPRGEIDIIARRAGILVFVEVKIRSNIDDALIAVTPAGWSRIAAAAEVWAGARPGFAQYGHRFDLIALQPWRWPVHVADAWRPDFAPTRY